MANENFKVNQAGETGKNVLKLTENQTVAEFSFWSSWKSTLDQYILDRGNLICKMGNWKEKTNHFPTICYALCCLCYAKF